MNPTKNPNQNQVTDDEDEDQKTGSGNKVQEDQRDTGRQAQPGQNQQNQPSRQAGQQTPGNKKY